MPFTPPEDQDGILTRIFHSGSTAKVIDFFLDHRDLDYSLAEVSEKADISIQTTSKEIDSLEKMGFLTNYRTIGRAKLYRWNSDLKELELLQQFALSMAQVPAFQNYPLSSHRQDIIESTVNS